MSVRAIQARIGSFQAYIGWALSGPEFDSSFRPRIGPLRFGTGPLTLRPGMDILRSVTGPLMPGMSILGD